MICVVSGDDLWEYLLDPIPVYKGCPRSTTGFLGVDSCRIFTKPSFCLRPISSQR
jgi:hypothetical protein